MSQETAMTNAIDSLLESATSLRVDVEVLAVQRQSTSISFQKRKLDRFSVSETQQLGVRVIDGHHEGVAYSESLEDGSLQETLMAARENARMIEKEWVSELRGEQKLPTMSEIYNPSLANVTMEQKVAAAQQLETAALDFSADITNVNYSRYADGNATVWIANSKGLRGSYRENSCMAYAYCLANDSDGVVQDGESDSQRGFDKLNISQIAEVAARKTLARRGAERPQTGKYTVVFENRAAEQIIGLISGYFSAKAVDENRSPLKGKLNQAIFSKELSILDDPFFTSASGSRPFDEEGFAAQKTTLVEDGVLRNFLTNSVLARKMKLPHTASASRAPSTDLDVSTSNVLVRPGNHSIEQLMGADSKVILVTGLMGMAGFRATSGDFSIPVEGSLFEQGKLAKPLKDFLISGNILDILLNVEAVGNDQRQPVGSVNSPSLLVRGLNVAGKS